MQVIRNKIDFENINIKYNSCLYMHLYLTGEANSAVLILGINNFQR